MHAGRHATLADAVRHYSDLDENRLHADGEHLLKPLRLSADEIADLVAFLETLTPHQRPEFTPRVALEDRFGGSLPTKSRDLRSHCKTIDCFGS